jgi:phosphate acetyltransferase
MVMSNLVLYGAMLTKFGVGDGFVAGASHTTADVARAGLYCLKLDRKVGVLCSSFAVEVDNKSLGAEGIFIYGDCGIIPDPVPNQLAGIAIACGELINVLFDIEPKVALLSYSTKGSAEGKSIDKVRAALQLIKERMPDLAVDGELQGDSAIVPEVASIKCKDSKVAGKANVLVFPNLDAGNICYKLTQRICGARVVGPLMMGFNHPASDLSRGCGIQEIVDAVTITAVRAQRKPAE